MPSVKAVIAAASEDIKASLSSMCAEAGITDITVTDGGSLRELFAEHSYDIALLVMPFEDRFGADTAAFLAKSYDTQTIAFVPSKVYDEVCAKLARSGLLILPKSAPRALIINALRNAVHTKEKLDGLKEEKLTLTEMVNEIKLVNRAKCVLIEYLRISEKEAHRQMQKRAMDQRITLSEVAADILKTYEYN
ncbi:ANTAR domain-containing response regulator [Huintestinicola sp.]|uniref:ANTAR domain-containing response regulator n=1 Tax=Huintestinicola sp. TaxID=2981661 RepID=UPI003D7DFA23